MDGSVSRDVILFSVTQNRWKMKKQRKVIKVKTVNVLKECLWFKNYQQRNVFTSPGDSKEKFSLKLHVPKFQNRSSQKLIFSAKSFGKTWGEVRFSDAADQDPVTLQKKKFLHNESLSAIILGTPLLRNY